VSRRRAITAAIALVAVAIPVWLWPLGGRKVIRAWLKSPPPPGARFHDPEGLGVDAEGNIYVADEDTGTFWMLDRAGKELARFSGWTTGDSMVVIAPRHVVAIGRHDLVEFTIEGAEPRLVRRMSRRGHGEGEFEDPEGLSRDANGDLYATDEDHRRVLVFGREGEYARMFKVDHDPEGVCVFEDRVYVTFSKDGYVACYGKDGTFKFKFAGVKEPDFVCVGPDKRLYVTDKRGARVCVFDLEGQPLGTIEAGFDDPEDLAFDPDGNLVVADGGNHRIVVLTREGKVVRVIE